MKLYTDTCDFVIAESLDDARAAWNEHRGGDAEDFDDSDWSEMDPAEELGIWCDAKGDPCSPEDDGSEIVAKTAAQWAERGRGFLCSTEF